MVRCKVRLNQSELKFATDLSASQHGPGATLIRFSLRFHRPPMSVPMALMPKPLVNLRPTSLISRSCSFPVTHASVACQLAPQSLAGKNVLHPSDSHFSAQRPANREESLNNASARRHVQLTSSTDLPRPHGEHVLLSCSRSTLVSSLNLAADGVDYWFGHPPAVLETRGSLPKNYWFLGPRSAYPTNGWNRELSSLNARSLLTGLKIFGRKLNLE